MLAMGDSASGHATLSVMNERADVMTAKMNLSAPVAGRGL